MITPAIVICIYNRSDLTRRLLEIVKGVAPRKVYVIADGAKEEDEDRRRVKEVQEIVEKTEWPCEMSQNKSDINLGCKERMSSGLNWVFEQEEEAIILEDDCHPSKDFFPFCERLLEFHRNDYRVGAICGSNFQQGKRRGGNYGYYFSRFPAVWGWATWRRAWSGYDVEMKDWPKWEAEGGIEKILPDEWSRQHWRKFLGKTFRGNIDTWDFQFVFHCWKHGMLSVVSDANFVSNRGFREDATHTRHKSRWGDMKCEKSLLLKRRNNFEPHDGADAYTLDYHFGRAKHLKPNNKFWWSLLDCLTDGRSRWKRI